MLQHENPHIEVLNEHLWSVRFSLLPYIPQLNFTVGPDTDMTKEPFGLMPEGIVVLNKDMKTYPQIKAGYLGVMKLNSRQIDKELNLFSVGVLKRNNIKGMIYHACLLLEKERKKLQKGE